jgi:hypothetical protein
MRRNYGLTQARDLSLHRDGVSCLWASLDYLR